LIARSHESPDLSVVIPVFNEEENIGKLHTELTRALRGVTPSYEVIFVDDGSRDSTPDELRRICGRDGKVKTLRFRRNYGQTAAIQAGFDEAEGTIVVTMDGDLQNDPADIASLVGYIDQGFDVVSGWRTSRHDRLWSRRLPSVVANWLIARITGVHIHDNGCTLKAYRREVVKKARLYAEMHRFLVPMLSLSGCRIKEISVNHRPRRFGKSKYGLSRIWKVVLDLLAVKMLLRFTSHPAAGFAVLSFPFVVVGVIAGTASLYQYAVSTVAGSMPIVMPSITVLAVFAATHLLFLGMFAELVVRVGDYQEADPVLYTVATVGDKS